MKEKKKRFKTWHEWTEDGKIAPLDKAKMEWYRTRCTGTWYRDKERPGYFILDGDIFSSASNNVGPENHPLTKWPIPITQLSGDFFWRFGHIKTLTNAPLYVLGNFTIDRIRIEDLKGSPISVDGWYRCEQMENLKTLEGITQKVKNIALLKLPHINSLKGLPPKVTELRLEHLPLLKTLEGCPEVTQDLQLINIPLETFRGIPFMARISSSLSDYRRELPEWIADIMKEGYNYDEAILLVFERIKELEMIWLMEDFRSKNVTSKFMGSPKSFKALSILKNLSPSDWSEIKNTHQIADDLAPELGDLGY